jgi:hypothetical protein
MAYAFKQMCTHHSFEKMVSARFCESVKKDIVVSRETTEKQRKKNTGKKRTKDQCLRISEAKKKNMTDETRKRIGDGRRGSMASQETLQKMSAAAKKKWENPEYAKMQSEIHTGYKQSVDTIEKRAKKQQKAIRCIELNLKFESGKEATLWLRNQNKPGAPTYAAIGKYHTAGGYHWEYI